MNTLQLLRETLTMILAGGRGQRLHPLTAERSKPGVPFGGIYRIIDFTLSNVWNSGLRQIFVLTQYKSYSLDKHLLKGWQIFTHEAGEFLYGIPPQHRVGARWYEGTADAIHQNEYLIERIQPRRVLVLSGDHIYKMDYSRLLQRHVETGARLTVGAVVVPRETASEFGIMAVDDQWRVTGFQEKPADPEPIPGRPDQCLVNMGIYVFDTDALLAELHADADRPGSSHDFGKDIIPAMVDGGGVYAYPFLHRETGEPLYWRDIGTLDSYYAASMDLVAPIPRFNLYNRGWPIRTWMAPTPPAKTVHDRRGDRVRHGQLVDAITGGGTIIAGGTAERSVLGRNVRLEYGSHVCDAVVMDNTVIGEGASVHRAIIDKNVVIPPGMRIGHDREVDRKLFHVTEGGVVVIPKNWHPDA